MSVTKKYIIERTGLSKAFPSFSNTEYASYRSQWIRDNLSKDGSLAPTQKAGGGG